MSNIELDELKLVRSWEEALLLSRSYIDNQLILSLTKQFQNDLGKRFANTNRQMETVRKCHLMLGWGFSCLEVSHPRIADIGGGNGYMFDWIKSAYPSVAPNWIVYESKEIATAYQKYSTGLAISFAPSTSFTKSCDFDLTIISSAIQYLDNWKDILETAFSTSKYVLLMRVPLIDSNDHQVFVQTPGTGLYLDSKASWPVRMFSRKKFIQNLENLSEFIFSTYDPEETFPFEGEVFPVETYLLKSKLKT